MRTTKKLELRERRIDEALKESFPASDPPFFVGSGMPETGARGGALKGDLLKSDRSQGQVESGPRPRQKR
jgi:hypothetical protein